VKESVERGGMSPFFDITQCWEWWYMKKMRLISLILKERRRKYKDRKMRIRDQPKLPVYRRLRRLEYDCTPLT
jgi:hypothetical protein